MEAVETKQTFSQVKFRQADLSRAMEVRQAKRTQPIASQPQTKKTISFKSSQAEVKASVFADNALVYLELLGQEDHLKAITALLMQGLVRQGDNWIILDGRLGFNVNKAGNRRLIEPLGEGYAHCVLFHDSILPKQGMSVLLANSESEIFNRFQQWLQVSCPLPRLSSLASNDRLERDLFLSLKRSKLIYRANSDLEIGNKIACSIDTEKLFKDDYLLLREAIRQTLDCFYSETDSLGIMTRRQVIEELEKLKRGEERERKEAKSRENPPFYRSFLRNAPKLKAAEKLPYKKVIAKWFSSSMTWYATEYDPSDGTLFGYVENIGSPFCSEWGYFSIEELEKMAIDRDGAFRHYIDRDPHLSDCWLDIKGNLYSQLPQQAA